jgi:GT2 family glycosyltransferase
MAAALVDIVMLSYAATDALRQMTWDSLKTLAESEDPDRVRFHTVVLESNHSLKPYQYPGSMTLYPEVKFGYNRFCNLGVQCTSHPFVCLCNNDLRFHKLWATELLKAAVADPRALSFSPVDPWLHERYGVSEADGLIYGYERMKHVTGWCFMVRREIFQIIGPLDEKLEFWYVDDDYAQTLIKHRIPHVLVPTSKVDHLSGQTVGHSSIERDTRERLTSKQWLYYDYKWNHHSRVILGLKMVRFRLRSILQFLFMGSKTRISGI